MGSHGNTRCDSFIPLEYCLIHEHIDTYVPCRHMFENFAAVETKLLHLQPFINSHFHFLIFIESVAHTNYSMMGQCQDQGGFFTKFPVKSCHNCCMIQVCGRLHCHAEGLNLTNSPVCSCKQCLAVVTAGFCIDCSLSHQM